eukprot:11698117-Ditylum_brightwellii.AAC.1
MANYSAIEMDKETLGVGKDIIFLSNVIETVDGKKNKFLAYQVKTVSKSRKLHTMVSFPSD